MSYCELCEMDQAYCPHGLAERRWVSESTAIVLVSPSGYAHFPGCPHKAEDQDYSKWGEITTPGAWQRLGNGEQLQATGGANPDLVAWIRCSHCEDHGGPWS